MHKDPGEQSGIEMKRALASLEHAAHSGDLLRSAEAHLNVVAVLANSIDDSSSLTSLNSLHRTMLEHAERALAEYEEAGAGWGQADARLVRAAVLTDRAAAMGDYPERHVDMLQAIDDCYKSMDLLLEEPGAPLLMLAQASEMAIAILLGLRPALDGTPLLSDLEEWIKAQSELAGECLAWTTRLQAVGSDWLLTARLASSLAGSLPAPESRLANQLAAEAATVAAGCLSALGEDEGTRAAILLRESAAGSGA